MNLTSGSKLGPYEIVAPLGAGGMGEVFRARGDSKAIIPEGIVGVQLASDGRSTGVRGPDGKWGIWPLEVGGGIHPIPGLEANYSVIGWTPDGGSAYVVPNEGGRARTKKVSRVNLQTGKMEPWKTFGEETGAGVTNVAPPQLSRDGKAYAYVYSRILSEAYVVTGLK